MKTKEKAKKTEKTTMFRRTVNLSKKTGHGIASIAGKARNYACGGGSNIKYVAGKTAEYVGGVGSLVAKDVKKIPSVVSKAIRSKIEINIIMPKDQPAEDPDVRTADTTVDA